MGNTSDPPSAEARSQGESARLSGLGQLMERRDDRYLHLPWAETEDLVEELAIRLLEDYGASELAAFQWVPIPRGGLLVLGLLSYFLDLPAAALAPMQRSQAPRVVVDDVALTGYRFRQTLDSLDAVAPGAPGRTPILFAHLASPRPLRDAIEAREQGMRCMAARNLEVAPGDGVRRRRWSGGEAQPRRYWSGWPELISFPWSEPDVVFWNEATQAPESGWHLTSPHRCLKSRAAFGLPRKSVSAPKWRMPDGLVWGIFDGALYLVHGSRDEIHRLEGTARDLYRALVRWGCLDTAVQSVAQQFDFSPHQVEADTRSLIRQLEEAGLLEKVSPRAAVDTRPEQER